MDTRKRDKIYWVIQKRNKLFGWTAHSLYKTKRAAEAAIIPLENESSLSFRGYKIDRVVLVD